MKYAWIEAHRDSYAVTMMCELLGVSRSGLHAARARAASARARTDVHLIEEIRRRQRKHRGRYGRRRMGREISRVLERPINTKRIGRLMTLDGPVLAGSGQSEARSGRTASSSENRAFKRPVRLRPWAPSSIIGLSNAAAAGLAAQLRHQSHVTIHDLKQPHLATLHLSLLLNDGVGLARSARK